MAMQPITVGALLAFQFIHVLFLAFHDWIPLGTLNDVKAVRAENPAHKLFLGTLISLIPFAIGFTASCIYLGRTYPGWLRWWLWVSYALLFLGEVEAWWIPYFFGAKPERVARYEAMFGRTHAFLPARNGIRPNTLHVMLHTATVATLIVLGVLAAQQRWPNT
jgi:hypothetical protein